MLRKLKSIFGPEPNPFALTWHEWDDFEAAYARRHPIKYWVYHLLPRYVGRAQNSVSNGFWWVRHRIDPRHRYHIVRTGLKPGYHDKDDLMLHACFSLLARFVERECPPGMSWGWDEEHAKAWATILDLYGWWKNRPDRREDLDGADAEDQRQLHRLIDVRPYLWT